MMSQAPVTNSKDVVSTADIRAVLGALNESDLLEIASLRPTLRDLQEAATWLSGDRDIFGAGEPLKGAAAEIVAVLTPDEDETPPIH
jgi:hypothetical protein